MASHYFSTTSCIFLPLLSSWRSLYLEFPFPQSSSLLSPIQLVGYSVGYQTTHRVLKTLVKMLQTTPLFFQNECLSPSFPQWLCGKESTCNVGDMGSTPGLGRSIGKGNGNPSQYSCLGNPINRGA